MANPDMRQVKATLIAKRRDLKEQLRSVEQAIEAVERIMTVGGAPIRTARKGSVKEAIADIIRENGGVMHADAVRKEAESRGIELSPRDPKATVVTALVRLRDQGVVEGLGKNQYRWIYVRDDEPVDPDDLPFE